MYNSRFKHSENIEKYIPYLFYNNIRIKKGMLIENVGNKEKERKCGGECGKVKFLDKDFPKAKNSSGHSYWCKECSKIKVILIQLLILK